MKIIFLCHGNICRSPLAAGIMKKKIEAAGIDAVVDSAGFEPYHIGDAADDRAQQVASKHGIDISRHRARLFRKDDFDTCDRVYVMDAGNLKDARYMARTKEDKAKISLIMNLVKPGSNEYVPDPYYGGLYNFEEVYLLLDKACDVLVEQLKKG